MNLGGEHGLERRDFVVEKPPEKNRAVVWIFLGLASETLATLGLIIG